jgi:hypothetical protein
MGFLSSLFGSPKVVDKVSSDVRLNTDQVDSYMQGVHGSDLKYGDFTFEYLYTSSEPITQSGTYGSVIYIRIESPVHDNVAALDVDTKEIQDAIDKHQEKFNVLPNHLSKDKTRWIYFNMGKKFRVC